MRLWLTSWSSFLPPPPLPRDDLLLPLLDFPGMKMNITLNISFHFCATVQLVVLLHHFSKALKHMYNSPAIPCCVPFKRFFQDPRESFETVIHVVTLCKLRQINLSWSHVMSKVSAVYSLQKTVHYLNEIALFLSHLPTYWSVTTAQW